MSGTEDPTILADPQFLAEQEFLDDDENFKYKISKNQRHLRKGC